MKNYKGFSLIEVMVTMLLVTVGMLALGSFYLAAIQSEGRAQERVSAVHFAEQILENWQVNNVAPTPDCKVAGAAASALTIGTATTSCVPNSGLPTPFDILIKESDAKAPLPNGHLVHPNHGTPAVIPKIGSLLIDPTNAGSAKVKVRSVKVSWTAGGKTRDIVLTHITKR